MAQNNIKWKLFIPRNGVVSLMKCRGRSDDGWVWGWAAYTLRHLWTAGVYTPSIMFIPLSHCLTQSRSVASYSVHSERWTLEQTAPIYGTHCRPTSFTTARQQFLMLSIRSAPALWWPERMAATPERIKNNNRKENVDIIVDVELVQKIYLYIIYFEWIVKIRVSFVPKSRSLLLLLLLLRHRQSAYTASLYTTTYIQIRPKCRHHYIANYYSKWLNNQIDDTFDRTRPSH